MSASRRSKLTAVFLVCALAAAPFSAGSAQQQQQQQTSDDAAKTRPRRVIEADDAAPIVAERPAELPRAAAPANNTTEVKGAVTIRVGVSTDASSVLISSASGLRGAADEAAPLAPLAVSQVRLEARKFTSLSPQPPPAAAAVNSPSLATRAGNDGKVVPSTTPSRSPTSATPAPPKTRLVSRVNAMAAAPREVLAYDAANKDSAKGAAAAATPLLAARAPLVFAAENAAPLKYGDKQYRGRLEVFANSRGSLTVVNELDLEDYVRGVVPNEMSPGGGRQTLEALKAQAVAARTYAVANRGQFAAQGFDLLPSTRSQVYRGLATEHPLTNRAVEETRGVIATVGARPINALYTSTCGGRTEHAEHIFGGDESQTSYLRGRECAAEIGAAAFADSELRTSREPAVLRDAEHAGSARDAALLAVHNFQVPARLSDDWLSAPLGVEEARHMLQRAAQLSRPTTVADPAAAPPSAAATTTPASPRDSDDNRGRARIAAASSGSEVTRPGGWVSAFAAAIDGESRADVLLGRADVDYLLSFRDADEVPAANRADVALFLRDGLLPLYPDATLRPRQPLTRARALRIAARALEARRLFAVQKATARAALDGKLVLRAAAAAARGAAEQSLTLAPDANLFRAFGEAVYPQREMTLVGGEAVVYHLDARGRVDYLEARPAPNGAAADRTSPFSHWTTTLTAAQTLERLSGTAAAKNIGALVDLRVAARGSSRRAIDLEVTGTRGTAHVRGGRIRSALGLREQLFVIERRRDAAGNVTHFDFVGRGWGHGVGMCQVGAYGLARAGWKYDRILKNYYTGITLTKLY